MSEYGGTYRVKVFYHVKTQDSGIVEETGIIGPVKNQEEYTQELEEWKKRVARQWNVALDKVLPYTGELIR